MILLFNNPCDPSPCENDAACTDGVNDYSCETGNIFIRSWRIQIQRVQNGIYDIASSD